MLNFIKQAQGWYQIDEQQFPLQPGTIYLTGPSHNRAFEYQTLEEVCVIMFSEGFLKENVHADVFVEFPFLLTENLPATVVSPTVFAEFEHLYQQLYHEFQTASPFRPRLLGHLLVVLLLKCKEHCWLDHRAPPQGDNRSAAIVRHFWHTLEQHYRDLGNGVASSVFRVQDYAKAQHLHPTYLAQVIKAETGKPIGTWIAEKTIMEAKARLKNTRLAIKEIAYQLGFAEPAHFSSYFKKHTQLTPQQYRQQ